MWRKIKLLFNFFSAAVVFTYFIVILILLLNPHISIASFKEFFLLFQDLFVFYGPVWFLTVGTIFFLIQFFAERRYPIGIFSPPSITYFLSFTMMAVTVVTFFNYDYYYALLAHNIKGKFIKLLVIKSALVVLGILFVFIKKINKKWLQLAFLAMLLFCMISSYGSIVPQSLIVQERGRVWGIPGRIGSPVPRVADGEAETEDREYPRRKIRIVLMDGLSLNLLLNLSSEQKLLNFNLLLNKGVRGNISTFQPNLDLTMINSALTGFKPSEFIFHSSRRYKFQGIQHEFDIFPKYIFFRNSAFLGFISFYKKKNSDLIDNIEKYYRGYDYETERLLVPPYVPPYSAKSLQKKSAFLLRFSEMLDKEDEKYTILKKAFFLDDYIKNFIPNLKDSQKYYAVVRFPGLGIVSKYFYQYYAPSQLFSRISEADIKKYGMVIENYYDYYDSIIGNLMTTMEENELLVIMSFFEYEPLPVWRRVLVNLYGKKDVYVYKSLDSRGTILLYEKNALKKGYPLKMISILDIFPTLIYYGGFKLSKNLHGKVLKEIFTDEFQLHNPMDIDTNFNKIE